MKREVAAIVLVVIVVTIGTIGAMGGSDTQENAPTPTITPTPTDTLTATSTSTPIPTSTETSTPTSTNTPTPTSTETTTSTPSPTATPTPTPSPTAKPEQTDIEVKVGTAGKLGVDLDTTSGEWASPILIISNNGSKPLNPTDLHFYSDPFQTSSIRGEGVLRSGEPPLSDGEEAVYDFGAWFDAPDRETVVKWRDNGTYTGEFTVEFEDHETMRISLMINVSGTVKEGTNTYGATTYYANDTTVDDG